MAGDDFKVIGITLPGPASSKHQEVKTISSLIRSGAIDLFHIRKPLCDAEYVKNLITALDPDLHQKLVLHSAYELSGKFNLAGVHYKPKENLCISHGDKLEFLSVSCHSLSEIREIELPINYKFLSPVFDSISKPGYRSKIDLYEPGIERELEGRKVIALGGVTPAVFPILKAKKFAGAALLGYLWDSKKEIHRIIEEINFYKHQK